MDLTKVSPMLLLTISVMAACVFNSLKKGFQTWFPGGTAVLYLYTVGNSVSAAIFLALFGLTEISLFTGVLGVVFGIVTALQMIFNLKALEYGPLAYTTVIISLSSLIPTLSGAIIWKERLQWAHVVGVLLMVGCLVLSVDMKQEQKKASLKWILWCMGAFVCTGLIGIMQKWHQSTEYASESGGFLVTAFLCSTVVALLMLLKEKKAEQSLKPYLGWMPIVVMVFTGLSAAMNHKFNLYLSGVMDSAVFFPIANGGALVLTAAAAVILFRERLSKKQIIGIVLGIAAVIFLCNPFG